MSIRVERAEFDPVLGFLYYVAFKPTLEIGVDDVQMSADVEVALSVTENGDLADLTFIMPKQLRNPQALSFICGDGPENYVEPRVSVAVQGKSGETVVSVTGRLDIDLAGRIVGMVIQWQPSPTASA